MSQTSIQNLIISLRQICRNYRTSLLKSLQVLVVDPPPILRCGLARGTVYSVGDSADYVGSCINMAARLQKLPGVVFVFNQRGVETQSEKAAPFFREKILVRKVAIRGIGENELICILKEDHEKMTKDELKFYREP